MGIAIRIEGVAAQTVKKTQVVIKNLGIKNLQLILPLYNGKWKKFGCKLIIEGNIFNDSDLLIISNWSMAINNDNIPKKNKEQKIFVKIVNGAQLIKAYKIEKAYIEKYQEEVDFKEGHAKFNIQFKFSNENLKLLKAEEVADL